MTEAPGPTVIRVAYTSAFGPHTADYHTRDWTPPGSSHILGQVPKWSDDALVDVLDMVTALIGKVANFMPTTVDFNTITILTQSSPTSLLVPQVTAALTGLAGSAATPGYDKATQTTVTFRTVGNKIAKIVMLDCASFNNFDTTRVLADPSDLFDLFTTFSDIEAAWAGADNTRPNVFLGSFKTLNEKLRRAYRMT